MCRQTLRIGMDIAKQAQIDGIWLTWITKRPKCTNFVLFVSHMRMARNKMPLRCQVRSV